MKIQNLTKEVIEVIAGINWPENDDTLDLSNVIIHTKHLNLLLEAVNNNPFIKHLNLCHCLIENPTAIKQIALALETNKSLHSLYLSHNDLTHKQITVLFAGLSKNKALKHLDLKHNFIGEKVTERDMINNIKNASALESLDISHNGIQDVIAIAIAKALQKNKSLLSFNINDNMLNEASIESFSTLLLEKNQTITELYITEQYNPLLTYKKITYQKAQKLIDRHTNKNKTLRAKIKKVQKKLATTKKPVKKKIVANKQSTMDSVTFSKKFKKLFNYVFSAK